MIPKENSLDYFVEYRQNLVTNYFRNNLKAKKESFEKIKKILIDASSNDLEINKKIKELNYDEINNRVNPEIYKYCNNYKLTIFRGITLKNFSIIDQEKFRILVDSQEKQRNYELNSEKINPVMNQKLNINNQQFVNNNNVIINNQFDEILINQFKRKDLSNNINNQFKVDDNDSNSNKNQQSLNNNNINLIDLDDFPSVTRNQRDKSDNNLKKYQEIFDDKFHRLHDNKTSQEIFMKNLLIGDFRMTTFENGISDEMCMSYLFKSNNNILEAANLYYKDKYCSNTLKITYLFPDKKQIHKEFSFIAKCDDLFIQLYNEPNLKKPELFLGNRKIDRDMVNNKYIGNLNLKNDSCLIVKYG